MDFQQQDIRLLLEEAIPLRFEKWSPLEFEQFIAYLLEMDEFEIQPIKQGSGFPNVIYALKDNVNHVIISAHALPDEEINEDSILEGVEAMDFYQADQAWVITNGTFTEQARKTAGTEEVELWDWDVLYEALCQLFFEGKTPEAYFEDHPTSGGLQATTSELKLKVKWEAAEGIGSEWYNLGLTIHNPTDRNIYLHLQLPAFIDHKRQQRMADQWVDGEFVAGLLYGGASIRTNALFSSAKLGERPPGGKVVLTCHERLEVPATYHLEARLKGEACYIITYCYSIHSPEYHLMTLYRDHVLRKTLPGEWLIRFYYCISPWLIRLAAANRYTDILLRTVTGCVVRRLK